MTREQHEYELPTCRCPLCGYEIDRAGNASKSATPPKPGDRSLCFECGGVLVFADDLSLRAPTFREFDETLCDREMMRLIHAWRQMRGVR